MSAATPPSRGEIHDPAPDGNHVPPSVWEKMECVTARVMEREPRLRLAARAAADPRRSSLDQPAAASRSIPVHRATRELRLRQRIDGLMAQRNEAWRRQRRLEDEIRLAALDPSARERVLQARVDHLNRRVIALHEELREARNVA